MDYIETFAITLQLIGDICSHIAMAPAELAALTTATAKQSSTTQLQASQSATVIKQKGNTIPPNQLRLWEEFINDGREIASIAQIIEAKYKYSRFRFPAAALDFLFHTLNIQVDLNIKPGRYIKDLFKHHADLKRIRVCEAIELWLPKFERVFPKESLEDLYNLHRATYWDWDWDWE
jgi:hypothetical protein